MIISKLTRSQDLFVLWMKSVSYSKMSPCVPTLTIWPPLISLHVLFNCLLLSTTDKTVQTTHTSINLRNSVTFCQVFLNLVDHSRENRLHALVSYLTYSDSLTGMLELECMFAGTLLMGYGRDDVRNKHLRILFSWL